MNDAVQRALGRIEGELKGIKETQTLHTAKMETIDNRVNANEIKAARNGAVSGGLVGVGILLLKQFISNNGA